MLGNEFDLYDVLVGRPMTAVITHIYLGIIVPLTFHFSTSRTQQYLPSSST